MTGIRGDVNNRYVKDKYSRESSYFTEASEIIFDLSDYVTIVIWLMVIAWPLGKWYAVDLANEFHNIYMEL